MEAYNEASIVLMFQRLSWVKLDASGAIGGVGREAPDRFAELRRVLPDTEGLSGVVCEGQAAAIAALLEGGADAGAKDKGGNTPLDRIPGDSPLVGTAAYRRLKAAR